jgi:hypothetical protein
MPSALWPRALGKARESGSAGWNLQILFASLLSFCCLINGGLFFFKKKEICINISSSVSIFLISRQFHAGRSAKFCNHHSIRALTYVSPCPLLLASKDILPAILDTMTYQENTRSKIIKVNEMATHIPLLINVILPIQY